jgi:hypothetical protein
MIDHGIFEIPLNLKRSHVSCAPTDAGLCAIAAVPSIPRREPLDRDEVGAVIHRGALPLLRLA